VLGTSRSFLVGILLGGLTLPVTLVGQVRASWFGTWQLNLAKSSFSPGPPPFKRTTCRIEPWDGLKDGVKVTYDMVRPRGGVMHLEWSGRFDGGDYALQGVEDYTVTTAYRRIDDLTFQVVQKADGGATLTGTMTISSDGQTLTMISSGSTAVYDLVGSRQSTVGSH
jgi:hypothetical protein